MGKSANRELAAIDTEMSAAAVSERERIKLAIQSEWDERQWRHRSGVSDQPMTIRRAVVHGIRIESNGGGCMGDD
jgi:hypothetical protein